MAVQTEITRISTAKANIKTAIEAKGVTVPSSTKLDGYASLVSSIPGIVPTGTINITENGENIDVKQYAKANVNVEEPLKVTYWKANNITYVPGVGRCDVIPNAQGKLQATFYFNKAIDQTTVTKENFVVVANGGQSFDYTITYPTTNSILVEFSFASKSADPSDAGYNVSFNNELLTSLHGDLLITPLAISYNLQNTYDAPDYRYEITDTMSYRVASIDEEFCMAFIVDSRWTTNLRDTKSAYTLENSSGEIPCNAAFMGDNAVLLTFLTSDLSNGTYDVKHRGETCFSITITII